MKTKNVIIHRSIQEGKARQATVLFKYNLRLLRTSTEASLEELSKCLKIDPPRLRRLESGAQVPNLDDLCKITNYFHNISYSDLLSKRCLVVGGC